MSFIRKVKRKGRVYLADRTRDNWCCGQPQEDQSTPNQPASVVTLSGDVV
jgi:hypothetical protein